MNIKNVGTELADILSDRIIKSEYKPGERIVESRVAAEMGVSQSSVREALRILQQNGLVEISPRRGTSVTALSGRDVAILYEMLSHLYGILVRESLKNIARNDLSRIEKVMRSLYRAVEAGDAEEYFNNIFAFATLALDAVNSPVLKKTILDLWQNKKRIKYRTLQARSRSLKENLKFFKQLEKHIRAGDVEKAAKTMDDYMKDEMAIALKFFDG